MLLWFGVELPGLVADLSPYRALLVEACERDVFGLTVERLESGLQSGKYLAIGTHRYVALLERVPGRGGDLLSVAALAGEGLGDWLGDLDTALMDLAKDQDCVAVLGWGRPGWAKVMAQRGWQQQAVVMTKAVQI